MYNVNAKSETQPFTIEQLTDTEKKQLQKATQGYGKIRGFSREAGIHENTLRMVLLKGSGKPETIKVIREKLTA
jgi:hypothetical protein